MSSPSLPVLHSLTSPAYRLWLTACLALLVLLFPFSHAAVAQQKQKTLFLLSGNTSSYQAFKGTLQLSELEGRLPNQDWIFIDLEDTDMQKIRDLTAMADTVISVGEPAAKITTSLDYQGNHILTFLSLDDYHQILSTQSGKQKKTCGLVIDQPLERIIKASRTHLDGFSRFGVIVTDKPGKEIRKPGNITVVHEPLIDDIHATMRSLSRKKVDAIIAIHNRKIYNRHTARNILISSYHFNIPIIGYSSGFVRAGALMGIYTRPESLARNIGSLLENSDKCRNADIIYPSIYTIEINRQVAKSLGIAVRSSFREKTFIREP